MLIIHKTWHAPSHFIQLLALGGKALKGGLLTQLSQLDSNLQEDPKRNHSKPYKNRNQGSPQRKPLHA